MHSQLPPVVTNGYYTAGVQYQEQEIWYSGCIVHAILWGEYNFSCLWDKCLGEQLLGCMVNICLIF